MDREKVLFVYNPHAGTGTLKNKLADVIDVMMGKKMDVTICATQKENDAKDVVTERGMDYDRIICAGGDGTLHEVIHGLMSMESESRPRCGFIPAGTVNDFASGIHLPRRVLPATNIAVGDRSDYYDVGEMNGQYFSYVAAFGAFTSVSYETPQSAKNLFGKTAYILDGASKLGKIKSYPVHIRTDEEEWEEECILGMVTNAATVAGIRLYRKDSIRLDDGILDGIFVKQPKNPIELNMVMNFLLTGKANEQVKMIHSSQVEITGEEKIAFTLDGENGGSYKKAVIKDHKRAISFFHGVGH